MNEPRVTPEDVESEIVSEHFFTARELTFCVLVLLNGTKLVGVNYGPVSAKNFDAAYGRAEARKDAVNQIWQLLGFRLRDELANHLHTPLVLTEADALADLEGRPRPARG